MAKSKKKKAPPKPRAASATATANVRAGGGGGKKRKGGKRRRAGGGGGIMAGFSATDAAIAAATATGYGLLQASADEAVKKNSKTDEYKWFREAPMITPLGRAGTLAGAGWVAMLLWPKSRKYLRGPTVGLTAVAGVGLGRRKLEFYDEKEAAQAMMGGIGDDLALGGVSDDDTAHGGDVEIDVR